MTAPDERAPGGESNPREIWDGLTPNEQLALIAIVTGDNWIGFTKEEALSLQGYGLVEQMGIAWQATWLGRHIQQLGLRIVWEHSLALERRLAERDALLNKGANLINYSVSGMSVPILDWTRYIAECRALLGDAYREYDARGE